MGEETVDPDGEVVYEEVKAPHTIETGDSVKVKQVLDEATIAAVEKFGHVINYSWENVKLGLMALACVFAMVAQFYPMPFPQSRPLLGICCASYFIISTILQFIVTFVDKDTILFTIPAKTGEILRIKTSFPKFQEYFTFTVQLKDESSPACIGRMYVGKYFTEKGEFDEVGFHSDIHKHLTRYEQKKFTTFEYNHKQD